MKLSPLAKKMNLPQAGRAAAVLALGEPGRCRVEVDQDESYLVDVSW